MILAPIKNAKLVAVGGVTPDNAREYFNSGAMAIGVGSSLVNLGEFYRSDWQDLLAERAQKFVEATL